MHGLGQIKRTILIDRINQPRIQIIQRGTVCHMARGKPETEQAQLRRTGDFKAVCICDSARHLLGPPHMVTNDRLQSGYTIAPDDKPQLQRPKAATKFQRHL